VRSEPKLETETDGRACEEAALAQREASRNSAPCGAPEPVQELPLAWDDVDDVKADRLGELPTNPREGSENVPDLACWKGRVRMTPGHVNTDKLVRASA
jgi:hypothetical protein